MSPPNRFDRLGGPAVPVPARPAAGALTAATPQPDTSVPDGWLAMYDQPRRMIVATSYPRRISESAAQYHARLTSHVTAITTRALAAQGLGQQPCAGVRPAGSVDDTKTVDTPSSGGLSDAQVATISNTVASVLGQASSIVRAAMEGSDARAMAQIEADATVRLAELRAEAQTTTDPDQTSAINAQINALQAALTQISSQSTPTTTDSTGLSTSAKLALGAGGVLLLVLVVAAASE